MPVGGDNGTLTGQSCRIVLFSTIEGRSSNTHAPEKLLQ
jgi:hypothetical protein